MLTTHRYIIFLLFLLPALARSQSPRTDVLLNDHWRTIATDSNLHSLDHFESASFNDKNWKTVDVPHNWDDYDGYRRLRHGNRHGTAWYRKTFTINPHSGPGWSRKDVRLSGVEALSGVEGRRFFLFFEGVGSYASVWLNGRKAGYHAGGRTTFTLDVTDLIYTDGRPNLLAVQADHPANIKDLPWVCGGCSDERGFSEGSQPMGIFRPVHLVSTYDVRIEPFGVHIWNDTTASARMAPLFIETELKNYSNHKRTIAIRSTLLDNRGVLLTREVTLAILRPGEQRIDPQQLTPIPNPHLWSPAHPYLYTLVSELVENGVTIDRVTTTYGIRTIHWPIGARSGGPFLINGNPFFINGIAEYEHILGGSHAFSDEQVSARVSMIRAAGFNAFRDAHQPHNLRYQQYWDKDGLLWWPQLSAHIWYDTPEFKENFLRLLRDWVKERRNSPSLVLWGLQNESKLPKAFAEQCAAIIREMDPTASSQRKITTCNGGEGTDWDVPQNWTGTYGGDPTTYATDLQRQVLVGEYGGWRTLDLHQNDPNPQSTLRSEDQLSQLMETKIRLAESVKDKVAGHFFWLLSSHDNPGRVQGGEGWREIDRVGPVNYKGLFTPWEEPLDVFYMFRSNYVSAQKDPMVYIVSHTNPDRWIKPVDKDSIIVYSNCEEVELFNDMDSVSLGRKKRGGPGTHFQWNDVPVCYNVLYAIGYIHGRPSSKDTLVLNHLPRAPHFNRLLKETGAITAPQPGYNYIYRINCGGDQYRDVNGNTWLADRPFAGDSSFGSVSWTNRFPGLPPFFASQRRTHDPIKGTADWPLFQDFRYGRAELKYIFPLPEGDYRVELYFIEPWINWPGGVGERLFDIAVNDSTVIHQLDILKEAGHDRALKKTVQVHISGGKLLISFPRTVAGQALISAIAIASLQRTAAAPAPEALLQPTRFGYYKTHDWMDAGDRVYVNSPFCFVGLPPALYGASWLQGPAFLLNDNVKEMEFTVTRDAQVYIGVDTEMHGLPPGMSGYADTKTFIKTDQNGGRLFRVWTKRFPAGATAVPGPNAAGMNRYIVAATPVSTIEPAYDLKSITNYKAVNARASAGIKKDTANGKPVMLCSRDAGDTLEWTITTGVADMYSLAIRYANRLPASSEARLQLIDQADHVLSDQTLSFNPSLPGKWNYVNSSTLVVINAGTYRLRLVTTHAPGLAIEGLDVQ